MQDYFNQVKRAADVGLYFLALSGALVIPDMCSGMETSDGHTDGSLYKAWVNTYLAPQFTVGPNRTPNFTGDDCYGLRCSLLHQGRLIPRQGGYSRIIFVEPNGTGLTMHNNVINNDVLNIDVPVFVSEMVTAAERWLESAKDTVNYQANIPRFMQRYANGLPTYIVGIPVIA